MDLLWTYGRDVDYPEDEPNPTHDESWAEGSLVPLSSSRPKDLVPKLCHLGCCMDEGVFKLNPSIKSPWAGSDE